MLDSKNFIIRLQNRLHNAKGAAYGQQLISAVILEGVDLSLQVPVVRIHKVNLAP